MDEFWPTGQGMVHSNRLTLALHSDTMYIVHRSSGQICHLPMVAQVSMKALQLMHIPTDAA